MKVKINSIFKKTEDLMVEFTSAIGTASGIWHGNIPEVGNDYQVELEISEKLLWDETIKIVGATNAQIKVSDTEVIIVGKVVNQTESSLGVSLIDSIILIEVQNYRNSLVDKYVEFRTAQLHLYDINA